MQKIVIHKPGGYDRLKLETHPDPTPGPGEVRVKTRAIGVNYADTSIRMGLYESAKEYVGWPITPGFEFAGVVDAVGEPIPVATANAGAFGGSSASATHVSSELDVVGDLRVGDAVFGVSMFNAYASHVVVPASNVFRMPKDITPEQAAGFPAVFLTAWFALCELAHPRPCQKILVHSAAGGVGGALVQLGKILECFVVGVVGSSHKVETAANLGADVVIDKSREDLWRVAEQHAPDGYDVILDANGVATLGDSYRHLARPGKLVSYGFHSMLPRKGGVPNFLKLAWDYLRTPRFNPIKMTNTCSSVMAFNLSYMFAQLDLYRLAMGQLIGWLEAGKLVPPPITTYPLANVADAHRAIEGAQTVGKLILIP